MPTKLLYYYNFSYILLISSYFASASTLLPMDRKGCGSLHTFNFWIPLRICFMLGRLNNTKNTTIVSSHWLSLHVDCFCVGLVVTVWRKRTVRFSCDTFSNFVHHKLLFFCYIYDVIWLQTACDLLPLLAFTDLSVFPFSGRLSNQAKIFVWRRLTIFSEVHPMSRLT